MLGKLLLASLATALSVGVATPGAVTSYTEVKPYDSSISSSNVATDLKLLFGGDNPNDFDLNTLIPSSDDYDSSFSFLCMYPYGRDLYLYVYDFESHNYDFYDYSLFTISLSTNELNDVDALEDGQVTFYQEDYGTYQAIFINSYGYNGRFAKFVIKDILQGNIQERVYIDSCKVLYVTSGYGALTDTGTHEVVNELLVDGSTNDLVYDYYQQDYVLIDNATVACLLTPSENKERAKSSWNGNSFFGEYYEDFYYFFEEDSKHPIDDLVEVRYDYTLVTYDAYTTNKGNQLTTNREVCYNGLIDGTANTLLTDSEEDEIGWMGYVAIVLNPYIGSTYFADTVSNNSRDDSWDKSIVTDVEMTSGITIKSSPIVRSTVETKWAWRTKEKSYTIDSIINLKDDCAYTGETYWNQNDFINEVNASEEYDWAFLVDTEVRESTSWEHTSGWWIFGNTYNGISECHEVVDAMVTYMRYYTDGVLFELDALSTPVSTTFIGTSGQVMNTLHDQMITVFSSLTSGTNTFLKWLGISLAILVGIALIVLIVWLCVRHHNNKKNKTIVNVNTSGPSGDNSSVKSKGKHKYSSYKYCKNGYFDRDGVYHSYSNDKKKNKLK